MHELSVMTQVVESVRNSLPGAGFVRLESVRLEVGELTMLGKEQLLFAWGVLTKGGPLQGSRLVIVKKPAVVACSGCGYRGAPKTAPKAWSHTAIPLISCPNCAGEVDIVGGRETIVRSLKAVLEDDGAGSKAERQKGRRRASARGAPVAGRGSPGHRSGGAGQGRKGGLGEEAGR